MFLFSRDVFGKLLLAYTKLEAGTDGEYGVQLMRDWFDKFDRELYKELFIAKVVMVVSGGCLFLLGLFIGWYVL